MKIKTMIRVFVVGILLMNAISAAAQEKGIITQINDKGDTVIIGVENKRILDQKSPQPVNVESSDAWVSIDGNMLIIKPANRPGEVIVKFIYKDSVVTKRYYSIYLPKPARQNWQ